MQMHIYNIFMETSPQHTFIHVDTYSNDVLLMYTKVFILNGLYICYVCSEMHLANFFRDRNTGIWDEVSITTTGVSSFDSSWNFSI